MGTQKSDPQSHMKTCVPSYRLLVCLLTLGLTIVNTPVRAATRTVTSNADSGPGSLRAAITAAAAGDVIDFTNLNFQTIVLTTGELVIEKNLIVDGPGASALTISGNGISRVFRIASNSPPISVTITGLTIANGNGQGGGIDGRGGAIYNDHAVLTVRECAVSGSSAAEVAGGLYNFGAAGRATLILERSTVSDNASVNGGGIFNGGLSGNATPHDRELHRERQFRVRDGRRHLQLR